MAHIEDRLDEVEKRLQGAFSRIARLERADLRDVVNPPQAGPTYISGSSDRVYVLSEMPTRYMVNALNMGDERIARGIRREMIAELARRKARGQE